MAKKPGLPAVFLDEITSVTVDEGLVRITGRAGKHTLACVLPPAAARAVLRLLAARLTGAAQHGRAA